MDFWEVLAHGEEIANHAQPLPTLAERLKDLSLPVLGWTALVVGGLVLISLLWRKKSEAAKWFLYLGIALPVTAATLFLVFSTLYLNLTSVTGGPVHWHADFEVWACGKELDLKDPTGLSSRVGTPVFHEHADNRIHVEGVVTDRKDASLGKFFEFVGGEFHKNHLSFPTNDGVVIYENGDTCPDGTVGNLQTFVWKSDEGRGEFYQEKLENPEDYVISPHESIPPGDCIIIEFGKEKEETERLCDFYKIAEDKGEIKRR